MNSLTEPEINSEKSDSYEFGDFFLSGPLKELQKEGITLEIQRRVLDVLTYLIENRS